MSRQAAKRRGQTAGRRRGPKGRIVALAGVGLLLAALVGYLGLNYGWTGVVAEGDRASPFVLPDQHGREVNLADYLGRAPVVLVFYMTYD